MDFKSAAVNAALGAGKVLLEDFGRLKHQSAKSNPMDLVTNADLEAEKLILDLISKEFPDHDVLSEETPYSKKESDYQWIIDPLDGTLNYSREIPLFATSIALAKKGKVVLGVVNLPFYHELYVAQKGKGCFLNGKKTSVSTRVFGDALLDIGSSAPAYYLKARENNLHGLRLFGSIIYSLACVASGRLDHKITDDKPKWDLAAGALLVEEAGGRVTNWQGESWSLESKNLLATNGVCHEKALELLKESKSMV